MKTRGLFLSALLVGAVMAGCSNEETVNNDYQKPDGNEYFMAVNFITTDGGSRAAEDYAAASDDEVAVKNAVFYFLDANGNSCADPYKSGSLTMGPSAAHDGHTDTDGSDDQQSAPIIVMKNPTANPSSMVVLLNVPDNFPHASYKSLSSLQGVTGSYVNNANGFVMSNSVYADVNNKLVIGAPVKAENIYTARQELEVGMANNSAKAVPVHVERVVAKINPVNAIGANVSENVIDLTDVNGTTNDVPLKVTINGWWLHNQADASYLVKNLKSPSYTAWWNDAANLRSYWADSYDGAELKAGSWGSHTNQPVYSHENTTSTPTQLVVAATLSVGNDNGTTLIRWRNTYYTEEGFKVAFLNNFLSSNKYYYKSSEDAEAATYDLITKVMLTFAYNTKDVEVTTNDFDAVVTLNTDKAIYTLNGETATEVDAATVNAALKGYATVKLWNGGKTYYYLPIAHLAASNANALVRNHVYQLNLNSVAGLGTPVPSTDRVIIPTKIPDDELSYIAASVYVLKWRVVSQDVDLK